jgi:hypothetical protein
VRVFWVGSWSSHRARYGYLQGEDHRVRMVMNIE